MTVLHDPGVVFSSLNADDPRYAESADFLSRIARRELGQTFVTDHVIDELFVLARSRTQSSELEESVRRLLSSPSPLLRAARTLPWDHRPAARAGSVPAIPDPGAQPHRRDLDRDVAGAEADPARNLRRPAAPTGTSRRAGPRRERSVDAAPRWDRVRSPPPRHAPPRPRRKLASRHRWRLKPRDGCGRGRPSSGAAGAPRRR